MWSVTHWASVNLPSWALYPLLNTLCGSHNTHTHSHTEVASRASSSRTCRRENGYLTLNPSLGNEHLRGYKFTNIALI